MNHEISSALRGGRFAGRDFHTADSCSPAELNHRSICMILKKSNHQWRWANYSLRALNLLSAPLLIFGLNSSYKEQTLLCFNQITTNYNMWHPGPAQQAADRTEEESWEWVSVRPEQKICCSDPWCRKTDECLQKQNVPEVPTTGSSRPSWYDVRIYK